MPETLEGYRRSDVYDAIYTRMKDYRVEASTVYELVKQVHGGSVGDLTLLDVACGTGLHLEYFAMWFKKVVDTDISPVQLEAASHRVRDVNFVVADMRTMNLGTPGFLGPNPSHFDVVTCLFSAIGHMQSVEELQQAITQMARHLGDGGMLIVEPWLTPDSWQPGHLSLETVNKPDFKVARVGRSTRDGNITTLELHHVVATPDGIESYAEVMPLGLFTQDEYEEAFRQSGLTQVTFDPKGLSDNGRGLYYGIMPR